MEGKRRKKVRWMGGGWSEKMKKRIEEEWAKVKWTKRDEEVLRCKSEEKVRNADKWGGEGWAKLGEGENGKIQVDRNVGRGQRHRVGKVKNKEGEKKKDERGGRAGRCEWMGFWINWPCRNARIFTFRSSTEVRIRDKRCLKERTICRYKRRK